MRSMTVPALIAGALLTVSCASNPFQRFYNGQTVTAPGLAQRVAPTSETVQVFRGNDPDQDGFAMLENGFIFLGYSSFNAPAVRPDLAIKQAQEVGASTVVLYSKYSNTVAGVVPLVLPAPPTTATTTTQGSIYGPEGSATYSGTSNTTFSGGTTTYTIPYHINRYEQGATYWAKGRPPVLGVYFRDLNDAERHRLQRNRGACVTAVVKNSPAFLADILRGDLIVKFAGSEFTDPQQLVDLILQYAGKEVLIEIERESGPKAITVKLNPRPTQVTP